MMFTFFPFVSFSQIIKEEYPIYTGKDLGVFYSTTSTIFKVWAPTATSVKLRLYSEGFGGSALFEIAMQKASQGVWKANIKKNIKNIYYTFQVEADGKLLQETPDIYAKAVGVNGQRGMVVNMAETNPTNWQNDKRPH